MRMTAAVALKRGGVLLPQTDGASARPDSRELLKKSMQRRGLKVRHKSSIFARLIARIDDPK
jgi:hypothetical protein